MVKYFFLSFFSISMFIQSQPLEVAENTLKVPMFGEEVFYYGFCEGDQMIFSFEEMEGRELKEIEVLEMPSSSKFMDYKTKKIENKTITISKTGIYKFRFANSAIRGRVCKFKIQRVPASDANKGFNSSVYWRTVNDTSYITSQERYLIKADTSVSNVMDAVAKVHSGGNLNGNKTTLNFTLPQNTVAWSYYLGVDQAGQQAYEQATKQLAKSSAPILARIPGYGPLAALALGGVSYLSQLQSGEDIDYYVVTSENGPLFSAGQQFSYLKKGKIINTYSKMEAPLRGSLFVCLSNDNAVTGVSVAVKVTAILVNEQWGTREVKTMRLTPRQEAYLKN